MLKGIMIINGSLKTPKYREITELYREASQVYNIKLDVCENTQVVCGVAEDVYLKGIDQNVDFVLFLDKDIRLAKQLERSGLRLFNTAEVIAVCDDKAATCMALQGKGIPMPKTVIAPLIFEGKDADDRDYINHLEEVLMYPMVVKECYGSFGEQVYKVDHREELVELRRRIGHKPHIYQDFVATSSGRDVRLQVVGNKVVASMMRYSEIDFRANISSGGQMKTFTPPPSFEKLAIDVCTYLGADFAGVDLLFGEDEMPILCEVNSNAHIKNILTCTGVNVAEKIMAWIKEQLHG